MKSLALNKIGYASRPSDKIFISMETLNKIKGLEDTKIDDIWFGTDIYHCKNNLVKLVAVSYRNKPTPMVYAQLSVKVSNYTNLYIDDVDTLGKISEDAQEAVMMLERLENGKDL